VRPTWGSSVPNVLVVQAVENRQRLIPASLCGFPEV
jgi:hypothetical protein